MAQPPVVIPARENHTGTVIFLHGLGDSGHGWSSTIASIVPSYVKVICPTAPIQPVTLNGGYSMTSWFDLISLDKSGPEDEAGIRRAGALIDKMLDEEIKSSGVSANRIILGGFSQGGGLALHTGFRYKQKLAGLIGLSCWLPIHKDFPAAASEENKETQILQCHGDSDHIVVIKFGEMSANVIKSFNPNSEFKIYKNMAHSSSDAELRDIKEFIRKALPAE
jgi:lysophospholipase-2